MQRKVTELLLQYRVVCLLVVALITAAAFNQLPKLKMDNSNDQFFLKTDVTRVAMDEFEETFGNDDFVFILLETDNVFNAQTLSRIAELVHQLEENTPHLSKITWIGNVESIKGVKNGILIDELIPQQVLDDIRANQLLERIRQDTVIDPAYRNKLISSNGKITGIFLEFDAYPEEGSPRKDIPPAIEKITQQFSDLIIYTTGWPIIDYYIDHKSAQEGPIWLSAALLGVALILLLTTRSFIGILIPIATVILSVIWTMAITATLGFTLNLLIIMVPTLLLCVGIGDTMHVMAEFIQETKQLMFETRFSDKREIKRLRIQALHNTLQNVSWPILLTTLTTSIGFLAFLAIDLMPLRELGIQAAIGVWVALILTYLFAVPLLSFSCIANVKVNKRMSEKGDGSLANDDICDRLLKLITQTVLRCPQRVGIIFIVITGISIYGMTQLSIESNAVKDLPRKDPVRQSFEFIDAHMGGSMGLELLVKTGQADGIKNHDIMQSIDKLQSFLDDHPLIIETSSVVDQLKQMHRAVHENNPDYYRLPETNAQIAEYLLLYETGGGDQLDQFVSFTYDVARIQIRTRSLGIMQVENVEQDIAQYLHQHWQHGEVVTTGTLSLFRALGQHIATGQMKSFLFAFIAITLIMSLVLRSIKLGLIAMVPNVLPIIIALGAMGLAGAELNMTMLILAPMILGVAVDDSIHFFIRYRNHFNESGQYELAYQKTMATVGRPILLTTMVLMVGFMGFLFSDFQGPKVFAIASGLAFLSALLADFMFVPVLFRWLKPLAVVEENV
jgi:predicted RND superfamily exporter protein